jgi:hypothetical protein
MQELTITVVGHPFTLVPGRRYVAGRPMMADCDQAFFPVTITDITGDGFGGSIVATVDGLTCDQANELLAAFNNGLISFEGRVWGQETVIETDPEADPKTDVLGNANLNTLMSFSIISQTISLSHNFSILRCCSKGIIVITTSEVDLPVNA